MFLASFYRHIKTEAIGRKGYGIPKNQRKRPQIRQDDRHVLVVVLKLLQTKVRGVFKKRRLLILDH